MTQEDKELLLQDLCARLHCGVICQTNKGKGTLISIECSFGETLAYVDFGNQQTEEFDLNEDDEVKPYLRPMSSITDEEEKELIDHICNHRYVQYIDVCNKYHIDYRFLIEKGLAIEAPEGMYSIKNK